MLVSELIDRTLSEWLYPGSDEEPMFDTLSGDIDDSTLDIVLAGRAKSVPRDTKLEIGSELILVSDSSGSAITAAARGFAGSTATTHTSGDLVYVDPTFTRTEILNGLRSLMAKLYSWGCYRRALGTLTYTLRNTVDLPAGTRRILGGQLRRNTVSELYTPLAIRGEDWVEYHEFEPPKVMFRRSGLEGGTAHMVYEREWPLPTAEDDDLSDAATFGLGDILQEDLPMGVAGMVMKGRQVPRSLADRIQAQLASQGQQNPTVILSVGQSLLNTFRADAVMAERQRLSMIDPATFEWQRR